jgi:hypothetical protein
MAGINPQDAGAFLPHIMHILLNMTGERRYPISFTYKKRIAISFPTHNDAQTFVTDANIIADDDPEARDFIRYRERARELLSHYAVSFSHPEIARPAAH